MILSRVTVAADLQTFERCCEVTILAESKMRATCANKAGSYYWLHITAYTLVIAMGRQPIS